MSSKALILITTSILALVMNCLAQEAGTLRITATNFESENGQAVANLFREQDDLPKKPFRSVKTSIKDGLGELVFQGLPNGSYAVIVYHDKNDNGTLDHKLGLPNEPMGFSNNWNLSLFSGMPTFKKLRFEHKTSQTLIAIKID
jgi:uncharacterized protein (DUF2141 family)